MNDYEKLENETIRRMVAPSQRRRNIWRGGVLQIWITRACNLSCYSCTQGSNLGGKPSMITPEQFEQACISLKDYFGVVGVFGGNPSLREGTRIYTADGIFPIEELEGKTFIVKNLKGNLSNAFCRLSGKDKPLYKITLKGGHTYYATAEHEWPVSEIRRPRSHNEKCKMVSLGKKKTTQLRTGMRLPIGRRMLSLGFGNQGNYEDGFLAGWILGDGWITNIIRILQDGSSSGIRFRRVGLIANEIDKTSGILTKLTRKLTQLGSEANWRATDKCHQIQVGTGSLEAWLDHFGVMGKQEGLPLSTWTTASEEFRKGLIDALFSSDGTIDTTRVKGFSVIGLSSAHKKLIDDVSDLLGFYGIKTSIKYRQRKNPFKGKKELCDCYELCIEGTVDVEHFNRVFTLTHKEKQQKIIDNLGKHKSDVRANTVEIVSVELTNLKEDVWDISVGDDTHCFQLAHCVTGNCVHPQFDELCKIMRAHIPFDQRGLWCNDPRGKGATCRITFNPRHSNLNVHMVKPAYDEFAKDWPECKPFLKGLDGDSRHVPPYVAMKDIIADPVERLKLIGDCDINKNWSAMIYVFRGELRASFCEIAAAQAMLHEHEEDYPDTGLFVTPGWWRLPMESYKDQVKKHCHECGIPLRSYGNLALSGPHEQVSQTHAGIYKTKDKDRRIELVTVRSQLQEGAMPKATDYIENGSQFKEVK